nr:unnamed protein product [Callosobruchus chinensis]
MAVIDNDRPRLFVILMSVMITEVNRFVLDHARVINIMIRKSSYQRLKTNEGLGGNSPTAMWLRYSHISGADCDVVGC